MKLLNLIKPNILWSILIAIGLIAVLVSSFTARASDFELFATLGGEKTEVTSGETLQYVVTVRNDGTQNLNNVRVNQNFIPEISYVAGSTTAEKNNNTVSVDDGWTGSGGFNFGTLTPGQIGYLKFGGQVSSSATVGSTLQNAVAVRADEVEWLGRGYSITVVSANQTAILRSGDFMKVTNNTLQNGWNDTVTVSSGNVVEFLVKISNDGQFDARNVKLSAFLPGSDASTQYPRTTLSADNAGSVVDEVTIQAQSPFHLIYRVGHATLFGNTGLYNCPNGCPIPESFYLSPLNLGTVQPGESASIQVTFKADVFMPSSTPTPTPTPTPTTSPTSRCLDLDASSLSGTAPLTITFTGSGFDSNGSIAEYEFNFGDSSGGQAQLVRTGSNQASHRYENAGRFIASLLVKDSRGVWVGSGDADCNLSINVSAKPQVLGAKAPPKLPETGFEGALVSFALAPLAGLGVYLYRRFRLI